MADNEHMKEVVAGMIDRDMLIRWTFEAKDREIETLKNTCDAYLEHAVQLEQLAHDAAKLLEDISHPFRNVERYDVETWLKQYRELFEVEKS